MASTEAAVSRGARVISIPPPLYYGAAFGAGMLLDQIIPWSIGGRPATAAGGTVIGALGLTLTIGAVGAVIRHRTTIVPHRPVTTLLTNGPFRFSRNPMYTGLATVYAGGALLAGSWWPVVLLPAAVAAIRYLVIKPEEDYLAQRFGPEYADYRARVRRWL